MTQVETLNLDWKIFDDHQCGLSESPVWDEFRLALWWIDIPGSQLHYRSLSGDTHQMDLPSEPGCIALDGAGDLIVAARHGIASISVESFEYALIKSAPYDLNTQRFNDGKPDLNGRLLVTTICDQRDRPAAALYRFDSQGYAKLADKVTVGNGIAFSPSNKTMYWADSAAGTIFSFDYDLQTGEATRQKTLWRSPNPPARPDGIAVDVQGNLWVAMFEGQQLLKISPQGVVLAEIPVPMLCPTMPAFGGEDMKTLYLTSAGTNRSQQELEQFPDSGKLLSARVPVAGAKVYRYIE